MRKTAFLMGVALWACAAEPDAPANDGMVLDGAVMDRGPVDGSAADIGAVDLGADRAVPDARLADATPPVDAQPVDARVDLAVEDQGVDAGPECRHRELCNARDDDCDGVIDEEIAAGACARGVGACEREGPLICEGGVTVCAAAPGDPQPERCTGLDEDCDGVVDEDFAIGRPCAVGVGGCQRRGVGACLADGTFGCSVAPGPPGEEICNGGDDDCDGRVDEIMPGVCERGVGACRREAALDCVGGRAVCRAPVVPGVPEICGNAVDDDCDGRVDEQPAEPCMAEVGICRIRQPWGCGPDGWICAPDDGPVPPQCEAPDCPQPEIIDLGPASVGRWTVLAPTAAAPNTEVVIRGPGSLQLWTLGDDGRLVGPPRPLPGTVSSVVRRGAAYAAVETDARGWRWVALDAAGQIERRAPYFYEVEGEPSVFTELHSVDMEPVEGGYQLVFNVGKPRGLAMFGMRLGVDGAPGEAHEAGYTVAGGVLQATPAGLVVLAFTYNGTGWRGLQLPGLPRVSAVARVFDQGMIGGPGGRRSITRVHTLVPTDVDHLQLWHTTRLFAGTEVEAHPIGEEPGAVAGLWRGDHVLLAWAEDSPVGRGIRAQARSRTGHPLAPPFWLMTDLPAVRGLALHPLGETVLVVWQDAEGVRHARLGAEPIACGDLQCAPGEWPITPDGNCQGIPACASEAECARGQPVCGCDGNDYPDRCAATAYGVGVWRVGRCADIVEEPCIVDLNGDGPMRCLPCTAYAPVCVWHPRQFLEQGRIYPTLCDAQAANPEWGLQWTEGACQIPAHPGGCQAHLCDQACPVCGIDEQCYSARDLYGDCALGP